MTKKTILLITLTLSYINIFAQETKPCLFIGIYDKEKKGICSDKTWIHEGVIDLAEYKQRELQFREEHKNDESFSTSRKFVSAKQCVIVYEYQRKVSGWNCSPTIVSYQTGTSIENCKQQLNERVTKFPKDYTTQPTIIYTWCGKGVEDTPGEEQSGGGTTATIRSCPTCGFKFSNNSPSYNCVALEWWSLSTKTNVVDASGNFKQSTDPQAKSFTIEFRKQGEIYWTTEKRENSGKNTHTISGLDACTKYEVRLITTCDNGQVSAPTNIIRFTTACTKPGNLTVENITNNSAKVNSQRLTASITFPCAGSASTQIRIIEFKTSTTAWQEVVCNSGSPCILNALVPNTIYRVRARYKYGNNLYSNYTNEVSFTTAIN